LCIKLVSIKELYYDARPTKSQPLVSFLYTTLPKRKPKTQPHVAECFLRIRITQIVRKCTTFLTDRGFNIVFTTVRHRTTLRSIEPVTHNSHPVLCLRTGLVPSDFQTSVKGPIHPKLNCAF